MFGHVVEVSVPGRTLVGSCAVEQLRDDLQKQLRETAKFTEETPNTARNVGDVKQYLSYQGKDLVFVMIQKYRDNQVAQDETSGEDSEETPADIGLERSMPTLGELNRDEKVLVLIDEAHRSQASELHSSMREALPNAVLIGFTGTPIIMGRKKRTAEIFGEYIDRYRIKESQEDGATLPILYEGKRLYATKLGRRVLWTVPA